MNSIQLFNSVAQKFPFPEYYVEGKGGCLDVAESVQKHLQPGSSILDFGSGPCDKTAVIQQLGYSCTAYDDLSDVWHVRDGNQERILNFAKEMGINFHLARDRQLPFEAESFDMVMAHHVLEHFHDSPRELMNDLVALIKPRGLRLITVPNAGNLRKRIRRCVARQTCRPTNPIIGIPAPGVAMYASTSKATWNARQIPRA